MFVVEGVVLLILGLLAVLVPPLATLGVTIFLGWLFLVSGVMGLIATFWARQAPGFWWALISALLGIAAGVARSQRARLRGRWRRPDVDRLRVAGSASSPQSSDRAGEILAADAAL